MQTSAAGRAFIEHEEGTVYHLYQDQAGLWTIGVGHLVRPGEDFTGGINASQADALLANDLRVAESCVNSCTHLPLTQAQFDACASLAFNIGTGAFAGSTVVHCLNRGDYNGAADAFRMWNKVTDPKTGQLVVSPVLVGRRERERLLFLSGASDVA